MRTTLAVAVACLTLAAIASANEAVAAIRKQTHIPAEGLGPALTSLAKEFDFQVLYHTEVVGTLRTQGASGEMTALEALEHVLSGTGLTYKYLDEKTVTIIPTGSKAPSALSKPEEKDGTVGSGTGENSRGGQAPSGSFFRVAQTSPQSALSVDASSALEEVIVTAQKRSERLQDVPVPVTAISAEALVASNELRLADYYPSVPGLLVAPAGAGAQQILSIRGITTGYGSPDVGLLVDGVPFGSSTFLGGGQTIPDFDPADLTRVEVLRGPQGTLYGASSIGGLINFVTVEPSTAGVSGHVQAGVSDIYNGAGPGYNFRGTINIPLGDTLAILASAFMRHEPGYIDNPALHIDGINEQHVTGGRFAALWRPSDVLSLKLSALYQDDKAAGADISIVQPGFGTFQQNFIPGTGWWENKSQTYSATLTAKLGIAELTSTTGYNINQLWDSGDDTYIFGPYTQAQFGVMGTPLTQYNGTEKFLQEVHLSVPLGHKVDWLLGAFYTHENTIFNDYLQAENQTTGKIVGQWQYLPFPSTYQEYAAFTDITFHITDKFDVQLGGRQSHISQASSEADIGPYDPVFLLLPSPVYFPVVHSTADPFTYLLTPRLKLSPDLMVYARLASGYRAGGPNIIPGEPSQYSPDKTYDYEIGVKGDYLDHRLTVDASVYYINWKDIQLTLFDASIGQAYIGNGSRAKSQGVELEVQAKPMMGLTIAASGSFDNAVLTQALPQISYVAGASGERLPYSSRFSGNLSFEQEFSLTSRVTGFVGGAESYIGDRLGSFQAPPQTRFNFPAYATTNIHAGAKYESWTATLFVNNATDKRGILTGGSDVGPPNAVVYLHPRTAGLNIRKSF
jgi:iron complex outermembrane receptor protein